MEHEFRQEAQEFPWEDSELILEAWDRKLSYLEFYRRLFRVKGVDAGTTLEPYVPKRWTRSNYEYVAWLTEPSPEYLVEREFIGQSNSRGKQRRTARGGPLVLSDDPDLYPVGSLIEIRSGTIGYRERYQRIYRKDFEHIWTHVAFRQEDTLGWDRLESKHKFRKFYPWMFVLGSKVKTSLL